MIKPKVGDKLISLKAMGTVVQVTGYAYNSDDYPRDLDRTGLILVDFQDSWNGRVKGKWFIALGEIDKMLTPRGPYLSNQGTPINV